MSSFEDFVSLELPKRPFTPVDGTEGQLLARTGLGPRQTEFVSTEELKYETDLTLLYRVSKL